MKNRKRYPDEWHSNIRPAILARDKFRCTRCKIKQRSFGYYDAKGQFNECDEWLAAWARENGFVPKRIWLQVAHLDQDTMNNDPKNLAAMCPRCHLKYDHQYASLHRLTKRKRK